MHRFSFASKSFSKINKSCDLLFVGANPSTIPLIASLKNHKFVR
jgi:hypothetical protein